MVRITCTRISLLVHVLLLLYVSQTEGFESNRTQLIGLHHNATNVSLAVVPWVRRVRHQAVGCADRPWVCNSGEFPSRVRRRCCGNRCVEVTSDRNNCGVCGIRCPFNWQCCRGVCTDTNINPFNCGKCYNRCPFFVFCTYGMCGYSRNLPPWPPRPPKPPFPPRPPRPPFPPRPPRPPFPPKPPRPPFPPRPPKPRPPRGPEFPEPPEGPPEVGLPPLVGGPPSVVETSVSDVPSLPYDVPSPPSDVPSLSY